jgi:recombinational DNA repair protein (RecF pathway)
MQEYITDAIVLDKVDSGELDSRVFLYTKDFGKIVAKAKSLRKITSKLAGHLQPANLVAARIVEKNGVQLIDALTISRPEKRPEILKNLFLVKELAGEWQADPELWEFLDKGSAS